MKYRTLVERVLQSGKNDTWFVGGYDRNLYAQEREAAIAAVRRAGVPIDTEGTFEAQYDGTTIHAGIPSGLTTKHHPSNIMHDLAHWAVCGSLQRRSLPDFGLGRGPDSSIDSDAPQIMNDERTQAEEERASLLGLFMEFALGMPAADTLRLHSWIHPYDVKHSRGRPMTGPDGQWTYDKINGFTKAVNWLIDKGFIEPDGSIIWAQVATGCAR